MQVGEPVHHPVAEALDRVRRVERLEVVDDGHERGREGQVGSGDRPHHEERPAPEAERAVEAPVEPPPVDDEAVPPAPGAGPPDHGPGQGHREQEERADAVDAASRLSRQKVVVEVEHPGGHAIAQRQRVSEVLARERVEEPPHAVAVARQGDLDGMVRGLPRPDVRHLEAGPGLPGGALQGVVAQ